ncbi:putative inactive heme oxygenase 2, chloroplastic isoform X2 [Silene latifolia]|uniref:putative inactive heme oxygenase 2, chloroplastic isoform X2 n=1 Tax=Silene latifolia TaxID=37657 RepID=UPI003D775013
MAFTLSLTKFTPPLSLSLPTTSLKFNKHSFIKLSASDIEPITNTEEESKTTSLNSEYPPPLVKKRKRYRKEYPGESKGITEELRFVAMNLKNSRGSGRLYGDSQPLDGNDEMKVDGGDESSWEPSLDGFLKYLVDSKLVFDVIEGVVEDSNDVSYAYFRRTGLERSESLARDLEWFRQQDMLIPEPSNPGITYAAYLKELSGKSAPLFLCHFYNSYFSHIAGGQVIAKQVAEKLLGEKELDFYKWDNNAEELLKDVREKLNMLGEHWSRDDKNKCLKEATKSFRWESSRH